MNRTFKIILMALALPALAAAVELASTRQNLLTAYNQEVNARLRYNAFAAKADAENFPGAAGFFRALAMSEGIHAANHAKALKALGAEPVESILVYEVKGTGDNLKESLQVEKRENMWIYPAYVKQAISEGDDLAVKSFNGAMASEGEHARLVGKVLKMAGEWNTKLVLLICKTCGYTTDDLRLKKCPFCEHPREEFAEM